MNDFYFLKFRNILNSLIDFSNSKLCKLALDNLA
jgi:hypothetical protein